MWSAHDPTIGNLNYQRNLMTIDIDGAISGTKSSKVVKNQSIAKKLREKYKCK